LPTNKYREKGVKKKGQVWTFKKKRVKSGHLTYPQPVLENVNYFLAIRKFSGARESDVKHPDLTLSLPLFSLLTPLALTTIPDQTKGI
jgi:hypothetical protein